MAPAGPEIPAHDSTSVVILWSSHTCLPPRAAVWASTEWGIESKECCNTPEKVVVVVVGGIKWQSIKKEENNMKERWGRESERERESGKRGIHSILSGACRMLWLSRCLASVSKSFPQHGLSCLRPQTQTTSIGYSSPCVCVCVYMFKSCYMPIIINTNSSNRSINTVYVF